ncbi:MAG TPA: hypothetical protein VGV89_03905 [Thermoplasmata archaeon]|nr:hypothetical protein [Thermoplasmata archaeon]
MGGPASRTLLWGSLGVVTVAAAVLLSSAIAPAGGAMNHPRAATHPALGAFLSIASVTDGQEISVIVAGIKSLLSDTVTPLLPAPGGVPTSQRAYWLNLSTPLPFRTLAVNVSTSPLLQWSIPGQIAGGADVLPPMENWTWTVWYNGVDDSWNWSYDPATLTLSRLASWTNCSYEIVGTEHLSVGVAVDDLQPSGARAPTVGLVLANPAISAQVPRNDPNFVQMVRNLTPGILRWSEVAVAPASWNNTTGLPSFNFAGLGPLFNLSTSVGAVNMIDLPVGTWGDGNVLPIGMPLNTTLELTSKSGGLGYLPNLSAFRVFVRTFVNGAVAAGLPNVSYWNIGNEVPVWANLSQAQAYVPLFNAAAAIIHNASPGALVGSDVMARPSVLPFFAQNATGVGFLQFHFYPANGGCPDNTTFCPPDDVNSYYTDSSILARSADFAHGAVFLPPLTEQWDWYNLTHQWLPILNTESNLNSYDTYGTDPRQQTLFSAAWVVSDFVDAAATDLSAVTLFALEGPYSTPGPITYPYGGWGYSLAEELSRTSDVYYAPYWATELWGNGVAAGAPGLSVSSSDPGMVRAFAAPTSGGFNLVLANRNALPTTVILSVDGQTATASNYTLLDATTYSMNFNSTQNWTTLARSGVSNVSFSPIGPMTVHFAGYGVAVVHFRFGPGSGGGHASSGSAADLAFIGSPVGTSGGLLGGFQAHQSPSSLGLASVTKTAPPRISFHSLLGPSAYSPPAPALFHCASSMAPPLR